MSTISLMANRLDNLALVFRIGLTLNRTVTIMQKFFSAEKWSRSDYFETAGDVGYVFFEAMSGYKELRSSSLNETSSERERQEDAKMFNRLMGGLAGCSSFIGDFASGKSFQVALYRSTLIARFVFFVDRPLSFAPPSTLQASGVLIIKTTETAVYAQNIALVIKQRQILSNSFFFNARRQMLLENEKQTHKIPLTVPPKDGDYQVISEKYEEDPVFSKYICVIDQTLIRYPVSIQDGLAVNYYELATIRNWVREHEKNPCSPTKPLKLDQIKVDLVAQREIEDRMRKLNIPLNLRRQK